MCLYGHYPETLGCRCEEQSQPTPLLTPRTPFAAPLLTLLSFGAWRALKPLQPCGALRTGEPWLPFDDIVRTRGAWGSGKTWGTRKAAGQSHCQHSGAETAPGRQSSMEPTSEGTFSEADSLPRTYVTMTASSHNMHVSHVSIISPKVLNPGAGTDTGVCNVNCPSVLELPTAPLQGALRGNLTTTSGADSHPGAHS